MIGRQLLWFLPNLNQRNNMSEQIYEIVNKKWVLQILFALQGQQKISYKLIKIILHIPKTTLNRRLNELVKYKYLIKYTYGSVNKPHYTEYQISKLGLNHINNVTLSNQ